jgi:hypothetical protein
MNQAFSKSDKDPLTAAAASILFNEDINEIKDKVSKLKVGDKTNFGVVKNISDNSISFKAKDTELTKIAFNQRKIGSKDFILDKLMKLKEEVELDEEKKERRLGRLTTRAIAWVAIRIASNKSSAEIKAAERVINFRKPRSSDEKIVRDHFAQIVAKRILKSELELKSLSNVTNWHDEYKREFEEDFWGNFLKPYKGIKQPWEESKNNQIEELEEVATSDLTQVDESIPATLYTKGKYVGLNKNAVDQIFAASHEKNPKLSDEEIQKMMFAAFDTMMKFLFKESTEELDEGVLNSIGYKTANAAINTLDNALNPNGNLAKGIVKELGTGYINDFKKAQKHLNEITDIWEDIQMNLSMGESLDEGISFNALTKAQEKMSDQEIDEIIKTAKKKNYTDKQINEILLSGKKLKEESETVCEQYRFVPRGTYAKKAFMQFAEMDDVDDTEEFLKAQYMWFEDLASDRDDEQATKIAKLIKGAYQMWKTRNN